LITIITDDFGNPKAIYPTDKIEYGREVIEFNGETIIQRRYTFPIDFCPTAVQVDVTTEELLLRQDILRPDELSLWQRFVTFLGGKVKSKTGIFSLRG
jgi:hypothetical protein